MFEIFESSNFKAINENLKMPDDLIIDAQEATPEEVKEGVIGLFLHSDDNNSIHDEKPSMDTFFDCMVINAILFSSNNCKESPETIAENYTMPQHYRSMFQLLTQKANGTPTSDDLNRQFKLSQ